MEKLRLLPADFNPDSGLDFVFPLHGDKALLERTKQLLAFFGVKPEFARPDDLDPAVNLVVDRDNRSVDRQKLLNDLGVNLFDDDLQEIRFSLLDETLPLLFDSATLSEKMLGENVGSENLLERMLLSPPSMRLYLALARCSPAARGALLEACSHRDLAAATNHLALFGDYLDVRHGRLVLPGELQSWETILGAPEPSKLIQALVRRKRGRAIQLYYVLSVAPNPVRSYFTGSVQRLELLNDLLPKLKLVSGWEDPRSAWAEDPSRVLKLLQCDDEGLFLPLDARFEPFLSGENSAAGEPRKTSGSILRIDEERLSLLFKLVSQSTAWQFLTQVDVLEFYTFLQRTRPEMLSEGSIAAMLRSPAETPIFLDLVWDLHLPSDTITRYLAHCHVMTHKQETGWGADQTRTSQSIFFLLSALVREGRLSREAALSLFEEVLDAFDAHSEGTFVFRVAEFLSDGLLPALTSSQSPPDEADTLPRELAGHDPPKVFNFEGESYLFDISRYRLQLMATATGRQDYIALHKLLRVFQLLQTLRSTDRPDPQLLTAISEELGNLHPNSPRKYGAGSRRLTAVMDFEELADKIAAVLARFEKGETFDPPAQLADEIASSLHPELGVTLLTYCYAYAGGREIDALAFDPHFVRKHDFYLNGPLSSLGWVPTQVRQDEEIGTHMTGSLAGLRHQLDRLEVQQSIQSFGKTEGVELVPTILTSLRTVPLALRTDRAQEYVALSTRLARKRLVQAASEDALPQWCEDQLARLIAPPRRSRIEGLLADHDPMAAVGELSPSELFLLGEACLEVEEDSSLLSPALRRMRDDLASSVGGRFSKEKDQYGILLQKRLGLSQVSLELLESYEGLDKVGAVSHLFERLCDLKFKLAEMNYTFGLPAYLAELQGERALQDILPESREVRTNSWRFALEQIERLGPDNVRKWMQDLVSLGYLKIASQTAINR
jgi:hypothetical protein